MDRISPNFIYALILKRSTLILLHIIFCTFVPELWPLIYSKIPFPLNFLRTSGQILTNLYVTFYTTLGLLAVIFRTFAPVLWPLIYANISFQFNILRTNGQKFTKFYICIHIDKICVGIVILYFSHICTRVMALDLRQNFVSVQYLKKKMDRISSNFILCIPIDNIYIGIVNHHFSHICIREQMDRF